MFTTTAYAQTANDQQMVGGTSDVLIQVLPFVLIFVVFYFLLLRPQQVKMKQQKVMLDALQRGDQVITSGGMIGKIYRVVDENEVIVEIADGVRVRMVRSTITALQDKVAAISVVEDDTTLSGLPGETKAKRAPRNTNAPKDGPKDV